MLNILVDDYGQVRTRSTPSRVSRKPRADKTWYIDSSMRGRAAAARIFFFVPNSPNIRVTSIKVSAAAIKFPGFWRSALHGFQKSKNILLSAHILWLNITLTFSSPYSAITNTNRKKNAKKTQKNRKKTAKKPQKNHKKPAEKRQKKHNTA